MADVADPDAEEAGTAQITLTPERFAEMHAAEEFILTVSDRGFGKRTSSYEYRLASRGGLGIWNMEMSGRNRAVVAAVPVRDGMELMLVSDGGQMIRLGIDTVRIAGRKTLGVTLFRLAPEERVVSVAPLAEAAAAAAPADSGPAD